MNRPRLIVGDVVRLSKRGRAVYAGHKRLFNKMVVRGVDGDSTDGRCRILCDYYFAGKTSKGYFARKHLWNTGYNVILKKHNTISNVSANITSKNNNGQTHCLVCNQPTKVIQGLMSSYNVCQNATCSWYNN